jgi:hypothetical protein
MRRTSHPFRSPIGMVPPLRNLVLPPCPSFREYDYGVVWRISLQRTRVNRATQASQSLGCSLPTSRVTLSVGQRGAHGAFFRSPQRLKGGGCAHLRGEELLVYRYHHRAPPVRARSALWPGRVQGPGPPSISPTPSDHGSSSRPARKSMTILASRLPWSAPGRTASCASGSPSRRARVCSRGISSSRSPTMISAGPG